MADRKRDKMGQFPTKEEISQCIIETAKGEQAIHELQIADLRQQLAEAKAKNKDLSRRRNDLIDEYSLLRKDLATKDRRNSELEGALKHLRDYTKDECEELSDMICYVNRYSTTALAAEPSTPCDDKAKEFARTVIRAYCWGYDTMDGIEIQDLAESLGLIAKHTATKDDVDDESDFEVGDPIYKFTAALPETP
jgi:hypothetical protein